MNMDNVIDIFPANDFKNVAEGAKKEIVCGIVIGYDKDGNLCIFGGGMIDGRQPVSRDWLWMVASFQQNLLNGHYGG